MAKAAADLDGDLAGLCIGLNNVSGYYGPGAFLAWIITIVTTYLRLFLAEGRKKRRRASLVEAVAILGYPLAASVELLRRFNNTPERKVGDQNADCQSITAYSVTLIASRIFDWFFMLCLPGEPPKNRPDMPKIYRWLRAVCACWHLCNAAIFAFAGWRLDEEVWTDVFLILNELYVTSGFILVYTGGDSEDNVAMCMIWPILLFLFWFVITTVPRAIRGSQTPLWTILMWIPEVCWVYLRLTDQGKRVWRWIFKKPSSMQIDVIGIGILMILSPISVMVSRSIYRSGSAKHPLSIIFQGPIKVTDLDQIAALIIATVNMVVTLGPVVRKRLWSSSNPTSDSAIALLDEVEMNAVDVANQE